MARVAAAVWNAEIAHLARTLSEREGTQAVRERRVREELVEPTTDEQPRRQRPRAPTEAELAALRARALHSMPAQRPPWEADAQAGVAAERVPADDASASDSLLGMMLDARLRAAEAIMARETVEVADYDDAGSMRSVNYVGFKTSPLHRLISRG